MTKKVAIIGTTTWGTTLGIVLAQNNVPVCLLARTKSEADGLESDRLNLRFLPEVPFPPGLKVSSDLEEGVTPAGLVILAVPSHQLRHNIRAIRDNLSPGTIVVSATKGLELPGGRLPEHIHAQVIALAKEIARE